ncbi:hypothetical protein EVAR_69431_1 [Eumeta japonica]|uniref:Uncharacterized protein n=1 Tax=Eumeta variegata TaxID=151549 RepID=A0A4C2AAA7_EUMVA|nr:hypothetical protein EVAR_69431_1 [Eumeta japonica]
MHTRFIVGKFAEHQRGAEFEFVTCPDTQRGAGRAVVRQDARTSSLAEHLDVCEGSADGSSDSVTSLMDEGPPAFVSDSGRLVDARSP